VLDGRAMSGGFVFVPNSLVRSATTTAPVSFWPGARQRLLARQSRRRETRAHTTGGGRQPRVNANQQAGADEQDDDSNHHEWPNGAGQPCSGGKRRAVAMYERLKPVHWHSVALPGTSAGMPGTRPPSTAEPMGIASESSLPADRRLDVGQQRAGRRANQLPRLTPDHGTYRTFG
jgi:hypothetical protein